MNFRRLFPLLLLGCFFAVSAVAGSFNYANCWQRITNFETKGLPQSALRAVDSLMQVARAEKESPQLLKGWLYRIHFLMVKDQDAFFSEIDAMEKYTRKTDDSVEKAVLHSLLAKLYEQYFLQNSYTISQRTNLSVEKPADIKEWSANVFADTIAMHVKASLFDAALLQRTDALRYEAVMAPGKDSRVLQPSLYDFLCAQAIETLSDFSANQKIDNKPFNNSALFDKAEFFVRQTGTDPSSKAEIVRIYRQWISFRLGDKKREALVNVDLARLNYFNRHADIASKQELYLKALQQLRQDNASTESEVNVIAAQANYYLENDAYDVQRPDETAQFLDYKKRAFDLCEQGIRQFPNYKRIDVLKSIRSQITERTVETNNSEVTAADTPLKISLSTANIAQLEVKIYRVDANAADYYKSQRVAYKNQLDKGAVLMETRKVKLNPLTFFRATDTTLIIPKLPYGHYEYVISEPGNTNADKQVCGRFSVSDLVYFTRTRENGKIDLYVVNRVSGYPQSGVTIRTYKQSGYGENISLTQTGTYVSDSNGYCQLSKKEQSGVFIAISKEGDTSFPVSSVSSYFYEGTRDAQVVPQVSLFTDRAIYRPGQTVYYKGIAWLATKDSSRTVPDREYTVALHDVSGQEVGKQTVKANPFGSFSGSFVLPKGRLNGNYSLNAGNGGFASFLVEEYKRPTFEIKFDTIRGTPAFGDSVMIRGAVRSYAGFPLDNAKVNYRVIRRCHWLMRWFSTPDREIVNGQIKTDGKGNFHLSFVPQKEGQMALRGEQFYTYSVMAEVTDASGETQKNEMSFSVGDKSIYLMPDMPEVIDKNEPFQLKIAALNLNGAVVKTNIKYTLSLLKPETEFVENVKKENLSCVDKELLSGTVDTGKGEKVVVSNSGGWSSGKYLLSLSAKDEQGRTVTLQKSVVLYSPNDRKLPVRSYCWTNEIKTSCLPGESADILFGTSAANVNVLYELIDGTKLLESKWITFNDEMRHLSIPFKKEWGQEVSLRLTFVKDQQYFSRVIKIERKTGVKKLTPKFSVFRDKLLPGQNEEWRITIPELQSAQKQAECMVTMFDASLNAFAPHNWYFNPVYAGYVNQLPYWNATLGRMDSHNAAYLVGKAYSVADYRFDDFDPILNSLFDGFRGGRPMKNGRRMEKVNFTASPVMLNAPMAVGGLGKRTALMESETRHSDIVGSVTVGYGTISQKAIIPRQNFAETAFFYPQLRTDEKGEVAFSFVVPESTTRWSVKGLAHTQDLFLGQWSAEAITQKPFMVQPNIPRFVRQNDTLVVTTKLVNLSGKNQRGQAHLELLDAETNRPLKIAAADKNFVLTQDSTGVMMWKVHGFSDVQMLICKITASTGEFSDGEQHYLPVLPDKLRVTETLPVRVRGNQSKQYVFERLQSEYSKVDTKNLIVEMTTNPAWYAVQALPALSMPDNDCAVNWFAAYYANTLASVIVRSNPKIADSYRQWQESGNALKSNLEKNEEVKNLLLTETPWALEAQKESDQKQRIAQLFDTNRQLEMRRQAMERLQALQLENGAFSWFKGMPEDRFVSQYILVGLSRLKQLGADAYTPQEANMIKRGVAYADACMARDFDLLKRENKEWKATKSLPPAQIYYFYMRSFFDTVPVEKNAVEAVGFYQKLLAKDWINCTLFGRALIAVTAQRNGDKPLAAAIVKSLLENATSSEEKGMFWANNKGGRWWHESNIATQTAILEAVSEITKNGQQTDDMKLWLLSQKQTERWSSPIATADAVYALLMKGSDWLSGGNDVQIKLGKQLVKREKSEAGTGYFKTIFGKDEVKPEMAEVSVRNNESHPAWGAIYWQYEAPLDQITAQKGVQLSIGKKLYIERSSATGQILEPLTDATRLKAGDKLTVRLVVSSDRDMEYVALTDQRAACLEPVEPLSGCRWKERLCYYQNTKDASTQFSFSYLPKGTYVFEYSAWVTRLGTYNNGVATIQCQYAPEFTAHSAALKLNVEN